MEAAVILFLKSLGIALPKIIETLFIMCVVVFFLGFKLWPKIKTFFEDITIMRKSAQEAVKEGKEAKEAVKELSNVLKEHMVQTDLQIQQGVSENKELRDMVINQGKLIEKLTTEIYDIKKQLKTNPKED